MDYVQKLYEYNTALIQVEMALHTHIVDIHHKSGHAVHKHSDELITDLIKALDCTEKDSSKNTKKYKWHLFEDEKNLDAEIDSL